MSQLDLEKGASIARPSRIGNPGALWVYHLQAGLHSHWKKHISFSGLFSFASTTFILSLINVQARGVATPNVVVGMAIFTGGLVQLLAGMWEFPRGNVFGATGKCHVHLSRSLLFHFRNGQSSLFGLCVVRPVSAPPYLPRKWSSFSLISWPWSSGDRSVESLNKLFFPAGSFCLTYVLTRPFAAFSSYGAFWMSYATILIPSSGIVEAYANAPAAELHNALGIYLITWFMFTFFML